MESVATTQSPVPESMISSRTRPGQAHMRIVKTPPGSPLGEWRIALVAYSHPTSATSSVHGHSVSAWAMTLRTTEIAAGIPGNVSDSSGGPASSVPLHFVCVSRLMVTSPG